MTTGQSTKPLSEKLAERRAQQLADARHTTESAINDLNHSLSKQLNSVVTGQREQIEQIEKRLATAVAQAERLSRAGGLRSWTRPAAITVAVMLAVSALVGSGLLLTDWQINKRIQHLQTLNAEIQRAESMPRLGDHLEIRTIQGATYLVGEAWIGNMEDDGTQVVELTNTRN